MSTPTTLTYLANRNNNGHVPHKQRGNLGFQSEMQQQMPPRPPYRKPEFRVKTHSAVEDNNKHTPD